MSRNESDKRGAPKGNKHAKKDKICSQRVVFLETEENLQRFRIRAEQEGLSLSAWIKQTLQFNCDMNLVL